MKTLVRLRARLPLVSDSSAKAWIDLAYIGEWKGHPAGDFAFTESIFQNIVDRFNAQHNPIPLTYEHPEKDGGQPVPAAGWIHDLKIVNGHLLGLTEFTDRAASMVKTGEYRYCSVVVDFDSIDRRSGESKGAELFEVGLTNTPFLDGQQPIQLSARGTQVRVYDITPAPRALGAFVMPPAEKLFPGAHRR